MSPCDSGQFPQFKPTVTHADTMARASARTYLYATERRCDDVMRHFIDCVNMAGRCFLSIYMSLLTLQFQ